MLLIPEVKEKPKASKKEILEKAAKCIENLEMWLNSRPYDDT